MLPSNYYNIFYDDLYLGSGSTMNRHDDDSAITKYKVDNEISVAVYPAGWVNICVEGYTSKVNFEK